MCFYSACPVGRGGVVNSPRFCFFVASLMACNFHIAQICPVMYCIVLSCPVQRAITTYNRQLAGESRNKAEAAL